MIVSGYKFNGYNATYESAYFDVREGKNASKNRVLEVTDVESGLTFVFEHDNDKGYVRQHRKKGS